MTTVVRPSEADLSAIARRINGPLSPEGAESWYRNDGATLLEEVRTLRQDAEAARQAFYADGAQAEPDAPLYEWAKAWKANATGFWEKTQTKNLRQRITDLTRANEDLQARIEAQHEEHERHVTVLTERWNELHAEIKTQITRALGLF